MGFRRRAKLVERKPVNLGSGREIGIEDLVHLIIRLTGFDGKIVWDTSKPGVVRGTILSSIILFMTPTLGKPDGQPRRCLDTSKAERLFGFRAKMDFEEGLRRMVEWYRSTLHVHPTPEEW